MKSSFDESGKERARASDAPAPDCTTIERRKVRAVRTSRAKICNRKTCRGRICRQRVITPVRRDEAQDDRRHVGDVTVSGDVRRDADRDRRRRQTTAEVAAKDAVLEVHDVRRSARHAGGAGAFRFFVCRARAERIVALRPPIRLFDGSSRVELSSCAPPWPAVRT